MRITTLRQRVPARPTAARRWALTLSLAVTLTAAGCGGDGTSGDDKDATTADGSGSDTAALDTAVADVPGPTPTETPEGKAFAATYALQLQSAKAMTLGELHSLYPDPAPATPPALGYDAAKATYMDLITKEMKPGAAEQAKLAANGFVSSDAWQHDTMADALLWVFQKDLPVLVTSDMILQALHASYDDILKTMEQHALVPTIEAMLVQAHTALGKLPAPSDAMAQDARVDADFFLTVARNLLGTTKVAALGGKAVDDEVAAFLAKIEAKQMAEVEIFGAKRVMDFSQFEVRGHYEGNPVLERYFRTLMWLGRVDLRFVEPDAAAGTWVQRPRQLMVAIDLQTAMAGKPRQAWTTADRLVTLMVGPVDYLDLHSMDKLQKDFALTTSDAVAKLDAATLDQMTAHLVAGVYGSQQIASHYIETNPFSSEPTPLPPSFALLGQRFVIDSHVFSNVVYDRVIFEDQKVKRVLPDPLDVMFALGNNHALAHLQAGLTEFPYQGALHLMRVLVSSHPASFWSDNVYNLWLSSLRSLSGPVMAADGTPAQKVPAAMKTAAWYDKQLRTQLASWAQLRHDTILYAKQSYTGGVACEHPDGYVEPVPQLWATLGKLAGEAQVAMANAPGIDANVAKQLNTFWGHWVTTMGKLQAIADGELKGEELTTDQLDFLKTTIVNESICGGPIFTGWYTSLFFQSDSFDKWRPTIADVHTNPNSGPLPGPHVLHVATGNVELMIFTADTCQGAEAFVGPVFRYHEVIVPEIKRLKDSDWETRLKDGTAPGQPAWTQSFAVTK